MKTLFFSLLFLSFQQAFSQDRNSIWCFGDSAGIDFTDLSNPVPFSSVLRTRGSCVSIADANGVLLFYAFTYTGVLGNTTQIVATNDSLMQNGGNIVGQGWYRELVITTDPSDSNLYYLFSIGETNSGTEGLYYSKIDMTLNSGRGAVIQKNIQLLPYAMQDGIQAIKHGNGRDWWIFCHRFDVADNNFYRYLVSPSGVSGPYIQSIGDTGFGGFLNINFSKSGKKAAIIDYYGLFEVYDFDRCTGLFSANPLYTYQTSSINYYDFWSCEFSPDETLLYVSQNELISYVFQINLSDSVPWNTRDTVWTQSTIEYSGGQLELGPDDKIYYASAWYDGQHFNFPYPDSAHYLENENVGVINSPDSIGAACDFQPYNFYLGGKRTYWGLPNNPDYELKADSGSICDSLFTSIDFPSSIQGGNLQAFFHNQWKTLFINGQNLIGRIYSLEIIDVNGKILFHEGGNLPSNHFTKDLNCEFQSGIYFVRLQTEKESLIKKFALE